MKNLSLVLNIVLLAAVGYLYFYNFSGTKSNIVPAPDGVIKKTTDSVGTLPRIAYVDLDSLNENIVFFKQRRKELEQQQKTIETEIMADYKALETKQNNFIQKNPNANPEQIQDMRLQLAQGQQDIEAKKQKQTQQLNQKNFELMETIQKKLKAFITAYNKTKKYQYILTTGSGIDYLIYKDSTLNITKDVVQGVNDMLKTGVGQ
jgi:outer membrane protein